MKFKINAIVTHPVWGRGIAIDHWPSRRGSEQYAVKFDKGGPMGFAQNATNDVADLTEVTK
jgi:hypothetical protein